LSERIIREGSRPDEVVWNVLLLADGRPARCWPNTRMTQPSSNASWTPTNRRRTGSRNRGGGFATRERAHHREQQAGSIARAPTAGYAGFASGVLCSAYRCDEPQRARQPTETVLRGIRTTAQKWFYSTSHGVAAMTPRLPTTWCKQSRTLAACATVIVTGLSPEMLQGPCEHGVDRAREQLSASPGRIEQAERLLGYKVEHFAEAQ